jgi:hypothetical protein
MILRILGEGQFEVADDDVDSLNELDEELVAAVKSGDTEAFEATLERLLAEVRGAGEPVPDDYLGPSEFVLPGPGATIAEVRDMLGEEGLIPD